MDKRIIGGVFVLLSAIMGMALGGMFIVGADFVNDYDPTGMAEDILTVCGIIFLVFGLVALIGAIMAITGKSFGLAIVGAVFGLLTIGPYYLGSIFALIGLIMILMGKDEFAGEAPQQPGMYPPPTAYPPQQPPPGYPPQQQPPMAPPPEQPPMAPPEQPPMAPPADEPPKEPEM